MDFTKARDSVWQWHQLGHMQVCISLQTDNHASTAPLSFFNRLDALPAAQPTASKSFQIREKMLKFLMHTVCTSYWYLTLGITPTIWTSAYSLAITLVWGRCPGCYFGGTCVWEQMSGRGLHLCCLTDCLDFLFFLPLLSFAVFFLLKFTVKRVIWGRWMIEMWDGIDWKYRHCVGHFQIN